MIITLNATSDTTVLQIPTWMPGFYVLGDYSKNLSDVAFLVDGKSVNPTSPDNHTWSVNSVKGKPVTVSYSAPFEFTNSIGHYSGAPTYMYVVGREREKCRLHINGPKEWSIDVGLEGSKFDYTAPTYDVLADNSVTVGEVREASYVTVGKVHTLAVRGSAAKTVDIDKLRAICETVSQIETDFFGGAPYAKYVWQFSLHSGRGGGSGIEHLSSTEIGMGSDLGGGTVGLLAHEFFHLWNVKRIRSKVLGPFDYTQLPKTGALWWLEGVTDYFAQSLLRRYGATTDEQFFGDIAGDFRNLSSRAERLQVSPYDSSYRVGETNGGRGNSDGFGISYYECGLLIGLCLDIDLLKASDGARSLDDVEFALWRMCRNDKPGFEEDEIRKQLIVAGGPRFGEIYDNLVMKPGDLPVAEAIAAVGLQIETTPTAPSSKPRPRLSIRSVASPTDAQLRLRSIWLGKRKH